MTSRSAKKFRQENAILFSDSESENESDNQIESNSSESEPK